MGKNKKMILGLVLSAILFFVSPAFTSFASSEIPDCFDFGATTLSIPAGGKQNMWLRASYDYTYFIKGATSDATYLECDFKESSKDVVFHIGPDEQGGNVFFLFYVNDPTVPKQHLKYDVVEVYVQNRVNANANLPVAIAGGKTGTLVQQDTRSMLYNQDGVAMASFSLSLGNGRAAEYVQKSVENNGANYFSLVTGYDYAKPLISGSDKDVMLANGYAGVVINGKFVDWP